MIRVPGGDPPIPPKPDEPEPDDPPKPPTPGQVYFQGDVTFVFVDKFLLFI
jgi:hypothetical protein